MTDSSDTVVASTWEKPLEQPASIPDTADVVVIGGGIVGVSTAWFLARQGVDVVLCEKGHIAGEQSGRNWGWVRVQGRDTREIPMMLESMRIWESLKDDIGEDVGFTRGGCFFTANSNKELQSFEDWVDGWCNGHDQRRQGGTAQSDSGYRPCSSAKRRDSITRLRSAGN